MLVYAGIVVFIVVSCSYVLCSLFLDHARHLELPRLLLVLLDGAGEALVPRAHLLQRRLLFPRMIRLYRLPRENLTLTGRADALSSYALTCVAPIPSCLVSSASQLRVDPRRFYTPSCGHTGQDQEVFLSIQ